jgi:hypothetical protein
VPAGGNLRVSDHAADPHRRAPATVRPALDVARRISTFDEVTGGLDETNAL